MVSAGDLADYKRRVHEAQNLLYTNLSSEESLSASQNENLYRANVSRVRELLPKTEKIENGATSFEVNNEWLHNSLDSYEKNAAEKDKRQKLLSEITDKLGAIEERLKERETAENSATGKNQTKQKLDEILKRPEFLPPEKRESFIEKWWREFWEWLFSRWSQPERRAPDDKPNVESSNISTAFLAALFRYLFIALAVAVIGLVIWRVIPLLQNRRKMKKKPKEKVRVVLGETLMPDQTANDILSEAEKLALNGDIRLAIRKGYIALLCELSDRKVLGLARHKTNRDYLRDVRQTPKIYEPMRDLTGNFEKTWYGLTSAEEEDWQEFRAKYKETLNG